MRWRSLKMPGSPSSPFTMRYFGAPAGRAAGRPLHRGLEVGAAAPGEPGRAHLLDHPLGPPVVERAREGGVRAVPQAVGDVVGIGHAAPLEEDPVLQIQVVAADGDRGIRRGAGERVEEARDGVDRDGPRGEARPAVAQHLDDRLRPAHAVAAGGDHAEGQPLPLDLVTQRRECLPGADREPARAEARPPGARPCDDAPPRAGAPAKRAPGEPALGSAAGGTPSRTGGAGECGVGPATSDSISPAPTRPRKS